MGLANDIVEQLFIIEQFRYIFGHGQDGQGADVMDQTGEQGLIALELGKLGCQGMA